MVEFGIVAVVALTLIMAIMDFGFALYTYHLVSDVARMGSRYAMVRGSTCSYAGCPATNASVQTYVQGVSPGIIQSSMIVSTTYPQSGSGNCSGTGNEPSCVVQVQVTYPYHFMTFVLPGATWNITSTAQNVISQ
jgi:Flp pilus assembly protein TadG